MMEQLQRDIVYQEYIFHKAIQKLYPLLQLVGSCRVRCKDGKYATHTQTNKPLDQVCTKQRTRLKVGHQCL